MKNILFALFLALLISCNQRDEKDKGILRIDIESGIDNIDASINLSDYIESITYCRLETRPDFLIGDRPEFSLTDNEVVVKTFDDCYIFERKTGKFLRKIGKKGRGPGEYNTTRGFINPYSREIYFSGSGGSLLKYNFDGTFIKSIAIPEYDSSFESPSLPINFTWLGKHIIMYFANITGNETKLLMIINEEGQELTIHPNTKSFLAQKGVISMNTNESQFYHYDQNLYFKEEYSDTVFRVTEEKLVPKMILYLGKYQPLYEIKGMTVQERKGMKYQPVGLHNFMETESFFIFEFFYQRKLHQGIYSKNTGGLKIADKENGINNTVDGFVPFAPVSISPYGYLIGFIEAYKVLEWFSANHGKVSKLSPELQKMKNIKETDNPVVIIAKVKAG